MNRHANASAARAFLAGAFVCISSVLDGSDAGSSKARGSTTSTSASCRWLQALQAFSRQTELQYGYLPTDEEEERLVVGPIKGRFTASEVLTKLLPSGFTFEWINARTVSIVSPPVNVPPGGVKEAVAGKDQQRSELTKEQRLSMENGGGKSGSARGPYAFDWRVTVEGQRIFDSVFDSLDLDIPATVFDREDIDASGASTVTDLFRYVTQQPNLKPGSFLGDGTQFADLRGLGFDTTLVLINGRRTIATASALSANAFDLNSIPLGAVERIEIVSDSTSAIYGADAIGGVVNIVLRREHSRSPDSTSTTALRTVARSSAMRPSAPLAATVAHEVRSCSTTSIEARCSVANAIAGTIRISRASAAWTGVHRLRRPAMSARPRWRIYPGCRRVSRRYRPRAPVLR